MLKVQTYIGPSEVSGLGLFLDQDISQGECVWEYCDLVDITYSAEQWKRLKSHLSNESFKMIKRYAYKENGSYIVCMDNAQFMNHSSDEFNVVNNSDLLSMVASRDIKKGEELLCNYFEYSDEDDDHLKFLK